MPKQPTFDRAQAFLANILRLTLVIAIAIGVLNQRWLLVFSTSLVLVLTYLPYFIERRYKIYLPIEFESVIILFIYASLFLGEIRSYYAKFWWWDIVLHTSSSIAIGFAGFLILYVLYYKYRIDSKPIWLVVFAFCFGLAIGSLWEIFEFSMDHLVGTSMQKSGLRDTMADLIVDAIGSGLTSFIGYFYLQGRKAPVFGRLLKNFKAENPEYFKEG